ncbi:MAG: cupin domain-containing protein [Thermodesulfovibrionales bacterium]|jgi:mannose-6-phosphate isomerase-like protein (cupin superfamily)
MKERIVQPKEENEILTPEGCFILEISNSPLDEEVSITRTRVQPGVTTAFHRLRDTVERYVIIEGTGMVEVGSLPPSVVGPGDVVLIPAGTAQRIRNTGDRDLVFLCICTPRFRQEAYEEI